jgi:hypothetical protein
MSIAPEELKAALKTLKEDLGDGLVATDIWSVADAKSVVFGHDSNKPSKTIALLNEVTQKLGKTLKVAEFPGLGNYYFINLSNNSLVLVLSVGTYQQYTLVDLSKTTMGILMSVALPNLVGSLVEAEAAEETAAKASGKTAADVDTEKPDRPRKKSALRKFLDGVDMVGTMDAGDS